MATPKTFNELHKEACGDFVQCASNLSGLIQSFSHVMYRLCEIGRENGKGTNWVNSNAVTRLWINKLRSLSGETISGDWSV